MSDIPLPGFPSSPARAVLRALGQRLRTAAPLLMPEVPAPSADPGEDAATLLAAMVESVRASRDISHLWLLWTATASAFPTADELQEARRRLRLSDTGAAMAWLLDVTHHAVLNAGTPAAEMEIVQDAVLADVDFCATKDHHTGIQRVVRETVPRWVRDHDVTLVAWTDASGAFRRLVGEEPDRVLKWSSRSAEKTRADSADHAPRTLVVPWRSTVVLPENPEPQRCAALAALAQYSGNVVTAIGYDCIPVVSPELIHPGLPDRFMQYLSVIKYARTVAGISSSATEEFRGFSRMMPSQGLTGPDVVEVALPIEVPPITHVAEPAEETPLVMCVGSFEPRKNQLAVLHAAERLWREGHRFRLRFLGGGGWRTEFDAEMNRLAAAGRDVRVAVRVSDEELWETYRQARFSVFASLHEGYGLPVAESLAYGTPALTSNFGSTAEIAADGGALTVDPRDDDALLDAMRRLLVDDELIAALEKAARERPARTWDDYARELWDVLAAPRDRQEKAR